MSKHDVLFILVDMGMNTQARYQSEGVCNLCGPLGVCGCVSVLLCCLKASTPVQEELLIAVLATMMEWRNSKEDWFLFSSDLSKTTASQLSLSVEMMRFLSRLVTHFPTILGGSQWDFLLCSMLAWLEVKWLPRPCDHDKQIGPGSTYTHSHHLSDARIQIDLHNPQGEISDNTFSCLILNPCCPFSPSVEAFKEPDEPLFPLAVLRSVGMALTYVPLQQLTHNSLPARFVADQKTSLPEALQTLLNTLTPLLLFKARPLQLTVYHILDKVMPTLPECDGEGDDTKPEDDGEEPCL
ncbi:unnamed protein product [Oncorhynchus mykiss]|uniref:E3 ubiquitin-protein ligase listerin n=1 Tax=Oncorhynchus mykiss TaxID=8022 RepID=A0A060YWN6_ONCMY|nr:unnamed protein product [Oncorhynchus mykiss]